MLTDEEERDFRRWYQDDPGAVRKYARQIRNEAEGASDQQKKEKADGLDELLAKLEP